MDSDHITGIIAATAVLVLVALLVIAGGYGWHRCCNT